MDLGILKAFMKPEQIEAIGKFGKDTLEVLKETHELAKENNSMLRIFLSEENFKTLVENKIIKQRR